MDYNAITEDIIRLSDERNTWSSTQCIPVTDSEELLDIRSAAMGSTSSIPPGAKNQPDYFPTKKGLSSFYQFDDKMEILYFYIHVEPYVRRKDHHIP